MAAAAKKLMVLTTAVLAAVATAHAQTPSDVGGTFSDDRSGRRCLDTGAIMQQATFLFYVLATLDFAWGAPQLLRESDFMGLFLSLIKKLLVISFFYAVLINGQVWIPAIVNSFAQLGANAAGIPMAQSPSDIMAQGIQIVSNLFTQISGTALFTQPGGALTTILMACIVLVSYVIITLHYVVTKLEAIIVMSAGYIFLGFGGSRWTAPYFERYISFCVSTGVRLMLIYLMLGVFQTVSANWGRDHERIHPDPADQPDTPNVDVDASVRLRLVDDPEDGWVACSRNTRYWRGGPGWHGSGDWKGRSALAAATVAAAVATGGAGAAAGGALAATETAGAMEAGGAATTAATAAAGTADRC